MTLHGFLGRTVLIVLAGTGALLAAPTNRSELSRAGVAGATLDDEPSVASKPVNFALRGTMVNSDPQYSAALLDFSVEGAQWVLVGTRLQNGAVVEDVQRRSIKLRSGAQVYEIYFGGSAGDAVAAPATYASASADPALEPAANPDLSSGAAISVPTHVSAAVSDRLERARAVRERWGADADGSSVQADE